MMTKDEALKMAIEALEDYPYEHRTAKMDDALQACKEALEQPAQEFVACDKKFPENFDASLGIPAQYLRLANGIMMDYVGKRSWDVPMCATAIMKFMNTHPAPPCQECENLKHDLEGYMEANKALINREWQYLSYVEVNNVLDNHRQQAIGGVDWLERFAYAIQQASKEKNT